MKFSRCVPLVVGMGVLGLSGLIGACGALNAEESPSASVSAPSNAAPSWRFPEESEPREGTWLIWPHEYMYGAQYVTDVEDIWVRMTEALAPGEKVHIGAYDEAHRQHIASLLTSRSVPSDRIDYLLAPTDDSWARDTGPIFVKMPMEFSTRSWSCR